MHSAVIKALTIGAIGGAIYMILKNAKKTPTQAKIISNVKPNPCAIQCKPIQQSTCAIPQAACYVVSCAKNHAPSVSCVVGPYRAANMCDCMMACITSNCIICQTPGTMRYCEQSTVCENSPWGCLPSKGVYVS